jgi:hypothetical protein
VKVNIWELRLDNDHQMAGTVENTPAGLILTPGTRGRGWLRGVLDTYRPLGITQDGQIILRGDDELVESLPVRMRNQELYAEEVTDDESKRAE